MSERAPDRSGAVTAAGAAAVLIAALAFAPIVQGLRWWALAVLFTIVTACIGWLGRRAGLPAVAAAIVAATALPLLALAVLGGGAGPLGLIPTRTGATTVVDAVGTAFAQIANDIVPAADTIELAVLVAAGTAFAAIVVDVVAVGLRAPIAAMLVVLALALVPGKALSTGTGGLLLIAVAVAALLVVAADRRRRGAPPRLPGLLAGGAASVVVVLVAQLVLPVPTAPAAAGTVPLFGPGVDPLIRLGENLRRGANAPVLSYTTTAKDRSEYLRLAVLEDFEGSSWSPNRADGTLLAAGSAPIVPGASDRTPEETVRTVVVPASDTAVGDRLPVPYAARDVSGVDADFRWEEHGLTLSRIDTRDPVGRYTVVSEATTATEQQLQAARASAPFGDNETLTLPADVPQVITDTARRWTRGANTEYDAARAIQDRLRQPDFTYDEQTPAEQGYDGDGLGVIAQFLRVKAGYCVHYASTMAVMARILGIPSRIAIGYQPGTPTTVDGRAGMAVNAYDLHAWPELYFGGIGWVRFEPTPGRGDVPAWAGGTAGDTTATPTPTVSAAATPSAAATDDPTTANGAATQQAFDWAPVLDGLLVLVGVGVLGAIPGTVRVLVRRRRLRRARDPGGAGPAWDEVQDTVLDFGLPTGVGRSPREAEVVLVGAAGGSSRVRDALERLRVGYERQVYAPSSATAEADDVRTVVEAVRARSTRGQRVIATLAPRSLLGRMTRSRLAFRWAPPGSDRHG